MITIRENRAILHALLSKADRKRRDRAQDVGIADISWTGAQWVGECLGSKGDIYEPRIRVEPSRSFNCTCADKRARGTQVGPCKHVIALVQVAFLHLEMAEIL